MFLCLIIFEYDSNYFFLYRTITISLGILDIYEEFKSTTKRRNTYIEISKAYSTRYNIQ